MQLDEQSRDVILRSIRNATPANRTQRLAELRAMIADGHEVSLRNYLHYTGLDLDDLYDNQHCWSTLVEAAGIGLLYPGPHEVILRRATSRLLHIDDRVRLDCYEQIVAEPQPPDADAMSEHDRRLVRMLVSQLLDALPGRFLPTSPTLNDGLALLWQHPQVLAELRELFGVLRDRIDHLHPPVANRPQLPLAIHARYTRLEVLAAFGHGSGPTVATWQSGVFWLPNEKADLFAVTLDKSSGSFSPTTRYRDYAISRDLIHWESQSMTRADGETGRRYQHHVEIGRAHV